MDEFLNPPDGSWAKRMLDEVIAPARRHCREQRFVQDIQAGTLSREKLVHMGAELLWITNRFGNHVAAMGARCPERDHMTKMVILRNAVEESTHPAMIVKFLKAMGYDGDALLNDPLHRHNPTPHSQAIVDFLDATTFLRSFPEAVAAVGTMEAINPEMSGVVGRALVDRYGISESDVEWATVHAGEVEQAHAQAAMIIVEKYIGEDELLRAKCEYAVRRGAYLASNVLDAIYDAPVELDAVRPLADEAAAVG